MDGINIMYVQQTKSLAVIFDANLTCKPQINHIVQKLNRNSAIISKIRYKINIATALKHYDSQIVGINISKLGKIHIIQKWVLTNIVQAASRSPSILIFHNLH